MDTDDEIEMIVIGASSGGVDALLQLFSALPERWQVPIAVVLHIPPDKTSHLCEVFASRCRIAVKEVEDKEPILARTMYFAAPNYHMQIEPDRSFSLSCDETVYFSRPSIDVLFESAALAYGKSLLGIILTGASPDGAEGLRHVRRCGGTAWVQRPDDAASSIMPAAALEKAGADRTLSLKEMTSLLAGLGQQGMQTRRNAQ